MVMKWRVVRWEDPRAETSVRRTFGTAAVVSPSTTLSKSCVTSTAAVGAEGASEVMDPAEGVSNGCEDTRAVSTAEA